METVKFSTPVIIKGEKVDHVDLDFDKLTGHDMLAAETPSRLAGDQAPALALSQRYQAIIAAKLLGMTPEEINALPAKAFIAITMEVGRFLLE